MRYPEKSYYDILGVPRNASDAQIKTAYREQIKFFHPDVFQGSPEIARQKSQELNEAYGVLIDHAKRADYDSWLRMRDAYREETRRKAEEARRAEEERRKAEEEQERKKREEAEKKEQQKKEESGEAADGGKQAEKAPEQSAQERKRIPLVSVFLAVCLAVSIAAGITENQKKQKELDDTRSKLEDAESSLIQVSESAVMLHGLRDFYKRAEECCNYLWDTFDSFCTTPSIYTTYGDAASLRDSVRDRIKDDLSLVEDCFAECENLEAATEDDAALLEEVRRLCERALGYLDQLENRRNAEKDVALNAASDTMSAIKTVYTARGYYWDLAKPE